MNIDISQNPELVVPILNAVGFLLKNKTTIDNNWIPLILIVVGTAIQIPFLDPVSIQGVVSAVAYAASSIGIHQLFKLSSILVESKKA